MIWYDLDHSETIVVAFRTVGQTSVQRCCIFHDADSKKNDMSSLPDSKAIIWLAEQLLNVPLVLRHCNWQPVFLQWAKIPWFPGSGCRSFRKQTHQQNNCEPWSSNCSTKQIEMTSIEWFFNRDSHQGLHPSIYWAVLVYPSTLEDDDDDDDSQFKST